MELAKLLNRSTESLTKKTINGYTPGAAMAKAVTDSTAAAAIGTSDSLPTERDIYYGLPTINNSHSYNSDTKIYAPTTGGTAGRYLKANGSTSTPTWVTPISDVQSNPDSTTLVSSKGVYVFVRRFLGVVSWADGTDEQIADAIRRADLGQIDLYEDFGWRVGDERVIHLAAMSATGVGESHVAQDITMVLEHHGGKIIDATGEECNFVVGMKDMLKEYGYINNTSTNAGGWGACKRRTWCNNVFPNAIPETLRPIFKYFRNTAASGGSQSGTVAQTMMDRFSLRSEKEAGMVAFGDQAIENLSFKFDYYADNTHRYKYNPTTGQSWLWWLRSTNKNNTVAFCEADSPTGGGAQDPTGNYGISVFGCI